MHRIRLLLFITITWFFFVINIEDILANTALYFLNINPVTYAFMVGLFVAFLALPKGSKVSHNVMGFAGVFVGTLITLITAFFIQATVATELLLLNILLEVTVLTVSTVLAYQLSKWFVDYNAGIKESVFRPVETLVENVFSDVEKIERKISRARRFERELALININLSHTLNRSVDEDQLVAYLAETLQMVQDKGVINAWDDDTLMICVPASIQSTQVKDLIRNLSYVVKDVLDAGNELRVASFPRDGLVLSDLLANVSVTDGHKPPTQTEDKPVFYNIKPKFQTPKLVG